MPNVLELFRQSKSAQFSPSVNLQSLYNPHSDINKQDITSFLESGNVSSLSLDASNKENSLFTAIADSSMSRSSPNEGISISQSDSGFHKIPNDIREMMFKPFLDLSWKGEMPKLVAAFRWNRELYSHIIDLFYQKNTFKPDVMND